MTVPSSFPSPSTQPSSNQKNSKNTPPLLSTLFSLHSLKHHNLHSLQTSTKALYVKTHTPSISISPAPIPSSLSNSLTTSFKNLPPSTIYTPTLYLSTSFSILQEFINADIHKSFTQPVNIYLYNIPSYFKSVPEPMDFSTILSRLKVGFYFSYYTYYLQKDQVKRTEDGIIIECKDDEVGRNNLNKEKFWGKENPFLHDLEKVFDNCLIFNGREKGNIGETAEVMRKGIDGVRMRLQRDEEWRDEIKEMNRCIGLINGGFSVANVSINKNSKKKVKVTSKSKSKNLKKKNEVSGSNTENSNSFFEDKNKNDNLSSRYENNLDNRKKCFKDILSEDELENLIYKTNTLKENILKLSKEKINHIIKNYGDEIIQKLGNESCREIEVKIFEEIEQFVLEGLYYKEKEEKKEEKIDFLEDKNDYKEDKNNETLKEPENFFSESEEDEIEGF